MPLNVHLLEALEDEPKSLIDLRRAIGSPPQTTLRSHLRALGEFGIVERRRQQNLPGSLGFELADAGRELLAVAEVVRGWLEGAPEGPLQLGSVAAKSTIKALVEGWSSAMVRALAARPLSLTELDESVTGISYPSLERRFGAMRLAGLIEARPGRTRGTPYGVTDWLREAVAPLVTAACWERRNLTTDTPPVGRIEVESAFLLTVPLIELEDDLDGSCRLAVEDENGEDGNREDPRLHAGVSLKVEEGRVVSCVSRLEEQVDASVQGTSCTWINALLERDGDGFELEGDRRLGTTLIDAMQRALPGAKQLA